MRLNLLCLYLLSVFATLAFGQELDQAEFDKLHRELNPTNQKWKTIPWQIDLASAQHQAVENEKPLFIWAMDGHPLGCT